MANVVPDVRCVFTPDEKKLPELLEETFRLYLRRILAEQEEPAVQCSR